MSSLPQGYVALLIGASGGIGSAMKRILRNDPRCGDLTALSRRDDGLDITEEASVTAFAEKLRGKKFHLLVCATGALTIDGVGPEKTIRQLDPDVMAAQFRLNAIGPALLMKHFLPLLHREERTISAFLSARVGSIGDNRLGGWISYRSSKAALNQIIRTASIEFKRTHPNAVLVGIHPGTVETGLSEPFSRGRERMRPEDAASRMMETLDALSNAQTGSFVAYDGSSIEW
ncbi:SDR family NAD(P)-dependent oxidoreductase [Rhizobium sp. XQZ8]|uniref:SDR family NAD(P)-dependent oxidoreductase n=1 Tax=Rhizobium populisoli TaxID=2859785 RepID=UPI001CA57558|nr:SDR family NAD(P)-dependent oxidoreductase [Rhizobium populisoli]